MAPNIRSKIQSRGHFEVSIRPAVFKEKRFELQTLYEFVRARAVAFRGWDFPHVGERQDVQFRADYIFLETDWEHHLDHWAMFRSGQFSILRGYWQDWKDQSNFYQTTSYSADGRTIEPIETFCRMVEVFEFAARITNELKPSDEVCIEVTDRGLQSRRSQFHGLEFLDRFGGGVATVDEYPQKKLCSRSELLADPVAPAILFTRELFGLFGQDVPVDLLRDSLQKLRR